MSNLETLDSFVGQENAKDRMRSLIEGFGSKNGPREALLQAPIGCGGTRLLRLAAREAGANLVQFSAYGAVLEEKDFDKFFCDVILVDGRTIVSIDWYPSADRHARYMVRRLNGALRLRSDIIFVLCCLDVKRLEKALFSRFGVFYIELSYPSREEEIDRLRVLRDER